MREIKFRAMPNKDFMRNENQKNILNSIAYYTKGEFYDDTFIYGYLADGYIIGKTIETGEEYFVPSYWIPIEKDTIGQYTGLKDKNGKEIYEGDIISFDNNISIVFYNSIHCAFMLDDGGTRGRGYLRLGQLSSLDIEVIGNIYENKELLEEK